MVRGETSLQVRATETPSRKRNEAAVLDVLRVRLKLYQNFVLRDANSLAREFL
jgi:hypothetical protein